MSVFSLLRRTHHAKEQKKTSKMSDKKAGKQRQEEEPQPRRTYVPTHAATDAMLGAPAGWMRDDAERIRESNRKRKSMRVSLAGQQQLSSHSTLLLSPLHINVHESSSGSNSSASSTRGAHWRETRSSKQPARTYSAPNFSSLDAELYRARMSPPPMAVSTPPSLMSSTPGSSMNSSPSSTPSSSLSSCSTPSLAPIQVARIRDGESDYMAETLEEYRLPNAETFEMKTLPQALPGAKLAARYGSSTYIYDAPAVQSQLRSQRQRNPYAPPVKIDGASALLAHMPVRSGFSRASPERTLVPTTFAPNAVVPRAIA